MTHDLARRSVKAVIWNYLGSGGKIAAQLVIQIILARMLGPEVFGQYAVILVVIGFGWLVADSGFGSALIQKKEISDADIGYALGWVLLLSSISGITLVGLAPYIAGIMGEATLSTPLMACGPIIALQALSNISASLMRRNLDMKRIQIIQLTAYVLGFGGVAIFLGYLGTGVWSLVIGFLAQTIITLVGGYALVRHTLQPRLTGDAGLRKFGLSVLGTNLANWAIEYLDRGLIGRQWGIASLGAYSAASNLSRVPVSLLATSFQSVVFSSASRLQDDPARLRRGFMAVLTLVSIVIFPLSTVLALKSNFVIHTLYGDRWTEAGGLFAAFCVALPSYVLLAVTGPTLWAVGAVASELKIQIFTAFVLIVGLLLLAHWPLHWAIWFIPCLYLMRFALVYATLGQRIQLDHRLALRAVAGGITLAIMMVILELISDFLMHKHFQWGAWWTVSQGIVESMVCIAMIRFAPRYFMGGDLCRVLLSRCNDSKAARFVCNIMALKAGCP